tara:strand:- start:2617 stop:5859 length:3243 start_codon:yes stop_codon:yes gene_type:complete
MPSKFDFISPDILLREKDESQLANEVSDDGVLIVGQSIAGPAMKPVKINNLSELYEVFGRPQSGKNSATDIWRDGNTKLPTYGLYAAQAWLASQTSPVTFVRLLGEDQASSKQGGSYVKAGWTLGHTLSTTHANTKAAYGLFVAPSASNGKENTGTLAAIIYTSGASLALNGVVAGTTSTSTSSAGVMINSDSTSGQPNTFKLEVHTDGSTSESYTFHLNDKVQDGFIRNVLNCNPQKLVSTNQASTEKYFLGESHETNIKEIVTDVSSSAGKQVGILLPLASGSAYWVDQRREATAAKAGWFINRNPSPKSGYASYDALTADKLFRLVSLHEGEWFQKNYAVVIEDLKLGTTTSPDSSFTVGIQNLESGLIEEKFTNCNLNANSEDFIGRRIGTQFQTWDQTNNKYILKGDYPNISDYVYVEMSDAWKAGLSDSYALPFGFYGPARPKGFTLKSESSGPQVFGDAINSGTKATNVIANPSSPAGHTKNLTITIGGSLKLTIDFDSGVTYAATPTLVGNAHTLGTNSASATQIYAALAHLINQLDDVSAAADGATSVTITADLVAVSIYDIIVAGTYITDGHSTATPTSGADTDDSLHAFVADAKSSDVALGHNSANTFIATQQVQVSSSYTFPTFRLTETGTRNGGNYKKDEYFGVRHARDNDAQVSSIYEGKDYLDIARALPAGLDIFAANDKATETAFVFSLDEIIDDTNGKYYYSSGSHAAQTSVTALNGSENLLVTQRVKQFRAPFFGGFDGLDVTLTDPFSSAIALSGKDETSSYAYYSVDKVIDLISEDEIVRYDVVSMPGLTNSTLQRDLINNTAERGDALAIVDFDGGYLAAHENSGTETLPTVSGVIADANSADYNSSYAATYYPPVRLGGDDAGLVVPSSVAGIGVLAQSDAATGAPWFAPAGFNRGGIKRLGGNQGPRVSQAVENLNKADRDDLYQVNINPIANFPGEGTVVFGQKTLQQTPSALDRINVRRLMVYLKKNIGEVARTVLFDQNVRATWNRFKADADPILADARSRFGIAEYKLILDETTTTPDYVDRNILYAKVFVKPARAIEFIAIDFSITRSGIEF